MQKKEMTVFSSTLSKVGIVLLILVVFGFIALCYEDHLRAQEEEASENSIFSDDDFTVREYTYLNESMCPTYLLVVTNNSEYTVDFECNTDAYEADGTYIGVSYNRIKSVEPGNSGCMEFEFTSDSADYFEYTLYYEEAEAPSSAGIMNASDEYNGSTVTVTCENTGSALVKYARADIVLFDGDTVVGYDYSYLYETSNDCSISSGASVSYEFEFDYDFTDYEIYYTCQY
ncbi:MAG: hypothetical protein LIO37_01790 [Clostridiales bacterium]|nr:hypothetical protein [Clostridiales bacterium]